MTFVAFEMTLGFFGSLKAAFDSVDLSHQLNIKARKVHTRFKKIYNAITGNKSTYLLN